MRPWRLWMPEDCRSTEDDVEAMMIEAVISLAELEIWWNGVYENALSHSRVSPAVVVWVRDAHLNLLRDARSEEKKIMMCSDGCL